MSNYKSPRKRESYFSGIRCSQLCQIRNRASGTVRSYESSSSEHRPSSVGRARGAATVWAHTGAATSLALLTPPQKPLHDPQGPWPACGSSFLHLQTTDNILHSIVIIAKKGKKTTSRSYQMTSKGHPFRQK